MYVETGKFKFGWGKHLVCVKNSNLRLEKPKKLETFSLSWKNEFEVRGLQDVVENVNLKYKNSCCSGKPPSCGADNPSSSWKTLNLIIKRSWENVQHH